MTRAGANGNVARLSTSSVPAVRRDGSKMLLAACGGFSKL